MFKLIDSNAESSLPVVRVSTSDKNPKKSEQLQPIHSTIFRVPGLPIHAGEHCIEESAENCHENQRHNHISQVDARQLNTFHIWLIVRPGQRFFTARPCCSVELEFA
jgi:hypothetical protein